MILLSALIVATAVGWAALKIVAELRSASVAASDRIAMLLTLFAPAFAAIEEDPRAFLVWQPLAKATRQLFPDELAALDRAMGGTFPFASERIETAHAQWTTDWLTWEHAHDVEYKLKAAVAEDALTAHGGTAVARARFDAVEREKLEVYQRRYAEYVRVGKALQLLLKS